MHSQRSHTPSSTYRLQLCPGFGFEEARGLLDYLESLGASDLYLSPILEAREGSQHGYDVTDPTKIREDLGGEEAFEAFVADVRRRGFGILLDIVPNHQAASPANRRWMDVLEDGAASPWAHWFDINWRSRGRPGALETHVLLPILGGPYGSILESGELTVSFEAGAFFVNYHDWKLPLSPRTWSRVLEPGTGVMAATVGKDHPAVEGLGRLFGVVSALPPWTATDPDARAARHRGEGEAKALLSQLAAEIPEVGQHIEQNLRVIAGAPGEPETFDWLDGVLSVQPYRLCFWKLATERVSYRRFFDIGHLVGIRVEDRRVFRETHERLVQLVREGKIQGLRIDHIDGLLDPRGYLRRLRRAAGRRSYILVEKILGSDEELPSDWPVQGTTGYEALHLIQGPFVDRTGLERLSTAWSAVPGTTPSFATLVHRCKRMVLETIFGGELQALISDVALAAERDRHGRDLSPRQLGDALLEVSSALDVYRTYLQGYEMSDVDRGRVEAAVAAARRRNPQVDRHSYSMLERLLTLSWPPSMTPAARRGWRRVVQRWQQLTGPAMAKGLEDTALYIDARLLALDEVGADAETIESPADPDTFHERFSARQRSWPHAMVSSSSHDSKRSEDARARLLVLSEMAAEWEANLARWSRWHRPLERVINGKVVPDQPAARFIYQTWMAVWPLDAFELPSVCERVTVYLRKAAREAKVHTSWIDSDESYEEALLAFASDLCDPEKASKFHEQMTEMAKRVAFFGAVNSLSMCHLKLTLPGIPDVYQGSELWRLDLADPDNRRPVDFERRRQALAEIDARMRSEPEELLAEMLREWRDGRVKLFLISRLLRHRKANREIYAHSDYTGVYASGRRRNHMLSFARRHEGTWLVSAVPRLCTRLTEPGRFPLGESVWGRSTLQLPPGAPEEYVDVLTGRTVLARRRRRAVEVPLRDALSSFPVALLKSIR